MWYTDADYVQGGGAHAAIFGGAAGGAAGADGGRLRAADGYLEQQATEEALGELRRAQVEVERLEWLARRLV